MAIILFKVCGYEITGTLLLACSPPVRYIVGSSHDLVKPKTIKLVFVASPLSMQH